MPDAPDLDGSRDPGEPCGCVGTALATWCEEVGRRTGVVAEAGVLATAGAEALVVATSSRALACVAGAEGLGATSGGALPPIEDDGPTAEARHGVSAWSADLTTERRWRRWSRRALGHGFTGVAALGHRDDEGAQVVVTLLTEAPAWDEGSVGRAAALVPHLVPVLHLALQLRRVDRDLADVDAALRSRATIDQAVGVLMAHHRCPADAAMTRLRRASQSTGIPLAELAGRLVTDVAGVPPAEPVGFRPRVAG